jgi:hypothetical protein
MHLYMCDPQVIELEAKGPLEFEYDPEWLAIMRTTHSQMNLLRQHRRVLVLCSTTSDVFLLWSCSASCNGVPGCS